MRFLLDTHSFIWYISSKSPQIRPNVLAMLRDPANELYLSIASAWEISIKVGIGKLAFPQPIGDFIDRQLKLNQIELLNISLQHINLVATLPFHHRDPFDRLLIAQAIEEDLTLVSADGVMGTYPVKHIW